MNLNVALFYHSLVSDWNHGNAHFLRGIVADLQARGHRVQVFEPEDGWSRENLVRDHGPAVLQRFTTAFPRLRSTSYHSDTLDLDRALAGTDLVLVHEWSDPRVIAALGEHRRRNGNLRIFFHDTHHRAITAQHELSRFDLREYDGILAYGASLKQAYERLGWGKQVHVWHEAADIRVFFPRQSADILGDAVWIGNWGDDERSRELREYWIEPVRRLRLKAQVHGVRYPETALKELQAAGIVYGGWLPNFEVPEVFSRFKMTVHVPRRPYTRQLPGIPTIRPFEALACGIPLISAPWDDTEGLFRMGQDFLMANNGSEMERHMKAVFDDPSLAKSLAENGLETIRNHHTCGHRVTQLLGIYDSIKPVSKVRESPLAVEVH